MNDFSTKLLSIEQATDLYVNNSGKTNNISNFESSFQSILTEKENAEEIKFSKHANSRLESRNISLSDQQMLRLNQGVGMARGKSINESLVMMDDLAFIVNIKNNTVVTALKQGEGEDVFTNIDGAVIV